MQSPNSKPQFGPWLLDQVNSGLYEGLKWVDNNKFRVPWKHNSRKDCCDEDNKIFKAWAEASGKISENQHDKAKWKTNFRCALHSLKQFKMVEDRSKESDDPHKVYQIISSEYNYENQHMENIPVNDASPLIEDMYNAMPPVAFPPEDMQQDLLNHMGTLTINNQQSEGGMWESAPMYNFPAVQNVYPNQPIPMDPQLVPENHMPMPVEQPYINQDMPLNQLNPPSIHDLEITINYRSKEMFSMAVQSLRVQIRNLYANPSPDTFQICLPGTERLIDHKQIKYTQDLLDSVQGGLLLEVRNTGIYGTRQGKCHIFASNTDSTKECHPNKLPQNQEVLLLSFDKFVKDLSEFQAQRQGSPDYTIYLCFGEKFPDGRPREKKLITVKVVPVICRYLHEKAQMDGASSLQSGNISLQISHNSLFDLIQSHFGLPMASL